jgi:hypothetical protein
MDKIDELKSMLVALVDETLAPALDAPLTAELIDAFKNGLLTLVEKYYMPSAEGEKTDEMPRKEEEGEGDEMESQTPPETPESPKENESMITKIADENKELKRQIAELKNHLVENEFKALSRDGKINIEQRKHFETIARTSGVTFAREVYSSKPVSAPVGEMLKAKDTVEENSRLREVYTNMGMREEDIDKVFAQRSKNGGVKHG